VGTRSPRRREIEMKGEREQTEIERKQAQETEEI
jgi:hypothetical protein